jgi:hypothetical protein
MKLAWMWSLVIFLNEGRRNDCMVFGAKPSATWFSSLLRGYKTYIPDYLHLKYICQFWRFFCISSWFRRIIEVYTILDVLYTEC